MITERERELLERCLRLEAQLAGVMLPPAIVGRDLPVQRMAKTTKLHAIQRHTTAEDVAQMRALRGRGFSYVEIARRTQFSARTARTYTGDVHIETAS